MAELADAHGSGPCDYCSHEGSSPFSCIIEISRVYLLIFLRYNNIKVCALTGCLF